VSGNPTSGAEIKVHLPGKTPPWRTIAKAKDAVELVPPRDLVGKKYASCAIVGNSGMLVYARNGAEIDSHEMVMRFNGAPTEVGGCTAAEFDLTSCRLVPVHTSLGCLCSSVWLPVALQI
jgi:hypothetical protein